MKLSYPFPLATISQRFGENANGLYASQGLKGHTACDFAVPWGSPIPACVDGLVYSTINRDNPDLSKYRAVYQLIQDERGDWYEVSYGHLNDINVMPGQMVKAGDIIGTVGNTGPVFHNGLEVSSVEKVNPDHPGAHLHGPQVRPVLRVKQLNGTALSDANGVYRDIEGYYFQVINYGNGFYGCVDPMPFFATDSEKIQVLADATADPKQKTILQWLVSFLKGGGD